jgi:hypothetical protein
LTRGLGKRAWDDASPTDLVDAGWVSRRLGVTTRTLANWRASGFLPAVRIGRRWRYEIGVVEALRRGRIGIPSDQWDRQRE